MTENTCQNQIRPNRIAQCHQIVAFISLVLLPLPGWPAKIGVAILFVSLLRIPTTLKSMSKLLRMPLFLFVVGWWLLAVLSEFWASHPTHSLLASPLLLLIIPALFPLLGKPRPYILALGIGAVIHTIIQVITWLDIVSAIRYMPMTISGGLHWYPPFTALWSTCALVLLLGLILTAKTWRYRLVPLCIAIPLPASLLLAGTRVLYLIVPFATIFFMVNVLFISTTRAQKKIVYSVCATIFILVIGSIFVPGTPTNRGITQLANEISTSIGKNQSQNGELTHNYQSTPFTNSVGARYLWWRAGYKIWKKAPWLGHGNGTTKYQLAIIEAKMPTKYGADVAGFIIADPHASILATAIEQGVLGVVSMVAFGLLALVGAWKRARCNPSLCGLSTCWLVVAGLSLVHTIQFSGYVATLVVLLVSFTLCMTKVEKSIPKCSLTFPAE